MTGHALNISGHIWKCLQMPKNSYGTYGEHNLCLNMSWHVLNRSGHVCNMFETSVDMPIHVWKRFCTCLSKTSTIWNCRLLVTFCLYITIWDNLTGYLIIFSYVSVISRIQAVTYYLDFSCPMFTWDKFFIIFSRIVKLLRGKCF